MTSIGRIAITETLCAKEIITDGQSNQLIVPELDVQTTDFAGGVLQANAHFPFKINGVEQRILVNSPALAAPPATTAAPGGTYSFETLTYGNTTNPYNMPVDAKTVTIVNFTGDDQQQWLRLPDYSGGGVAAGTYFTIKAKCLGTNENTIKLLTATGNKIEGYLNTIELETDTFNLNGGRGTALTVMYDGTDYNIISGYCRELNQ